MKYLPAANVKVVAALRLFELINTRNKLSLPIGGNVVNLSRKARNEVLAPSDEGAVAHRRLRERCSNYCVFYQFLRNFSLPPSATLTRQIIISSATQKINIDFTATKV